MVNPYLEGNFAPVLEERTDDHALEVTGVVPPDLEGVLLRNGPNPLTVPERPGRLPLVLRRRDAPRHLAGRGQGHRLPEPVGAHPRRWPARWPPCRPGVRASRSTDRPTPTSSATPAPPSPSWSPASPTPSRPTSTGPGSTTSTAPLSSPMTAHPKVDPVTGELVFFGVDLFGPPFLRYHVVDATGQLTTTEEIDDPPGRDDARLRGDRHPGRLPRPAGASSTWPWPARAGRLPFRWSPEAGARVGVMARNGRATTIRWIDHGPELRLPRPQRLRRRRPHRPRRRPLRLGLRHRPRARPSPAPRRRSTAGRSTRPANRVHEEALDDTPVEFPRIDPAVAGSPHRYGYCVRTGADPEQPSFEGLVKYDFARDESVRFDPGEGRAPGEPVFVRAADGAGEDEGWVLSRRLRRRPGRLATWSSSTPPRSPGRRWPRCTCPARVPFGFHGSWVPSDS